MTASRQTGPIGVPGGHGPRQPLEGVTVLDVTEVWAGPMGISLLGDLGARVIKVESFPRMSNTRTPGGRTGRGYTNDDPHAPRPYDRAAVHNMPNRNKLGIALNLAHPRGLEVFKRLVREADVVAEAYAAGTSERMGFGYDVLKEIRPDIIMVSMPGWGSEGPYRGYVSLGIVLDAFTGHHGLRGYPDTDPTATDFINHADAVGALTLPFAVLMALYHRSRTGLGQWIDISQVEAVIPHLSRSQMDWSINQRSPTVMGNRDYYMSPHGCYRCAGEDDWVVIAVASDAEWRGLCRAMGDPDWTREPRFADPISRYDNQDELDQLLHEWTVDKDKHEVMRVLQNEGVPAVAVMDFADLYADPHLKARGYFREMKHVVAGVHRYPGPMWRYSVVPPVTPLPPNALGQHNDEVYGGLMGMSGDEMKELEDLGVIGTEFPDEG